MMKIVINFMFGPATLRGVVFISLRYLPAATCRDGREHGGRARARRAGASTAGGREHGGRTRARRADASTAGGRWHGG